MLLDGKDHAYFFCYALSMRTRGCTRRAERHTDMPPKRKNKSKEFIDDSDDPEDTGAKTKKARVQQETQSAGASASASRSDDDDDMIPLSTKRFVNVRVFNGRYLVNIREYYEDKGERKPGRKGISLTVDQWEKLKEAIPEIDAKIRGD